MHEENLDATVPDDDGSDLRDRLLLAMLPHVAFDGWTRRSLLAGAADAGLSEAELLHAAPEGAIDMLAWFSAWADAQMLDGLQRHDLMALRTRERVALGVRLRLDALAPYKEAVRRSISTLALPGNAALGMRLVARTVDEIWVAAGDTATDFNWYTKRGLLAGVLASTTLYWLDDGSPEHEASWAFLGRRIEDVMRMGRLLSGPPSPPDMATVARMIPTPGRFLRQLRRRFADG